MKKHYFPAHIIKMLQEEYKQDTGKELNLFRHCKNCGDCNPKFGYFPIPQVDITIGFGANDSFSVMLCYKCQLSDQEYLERFGERKSLDYGEDLQDG